MYISQLRLHHIVKYNADGNIVAKMGRKGSGPIEFKGVEEMAEAALSARLTNLAH